MNRDQWEARVRAYAVAREQGVSANPQGWRHADCDHSEGYCSAGDYDTSPEEN